MFTTVTCYFYCSEFLSKSVQNTLEIPLIMKFNIFLDDLWAWDTYLDVSIGQQQVYYNVSRQNFNIIHSLPNPCQLCRKFFACVEGTSLPDVIQNGFPEILAAEEQHHVSNLGQVPCICFSGPATLPQYHYGTFINRAVSVGGELVKLNFHYQFVSKKKFQHPEERDWHLYSQQKREFYKGVQKDNLPWTGLCYLQELNESIHQR